jgi:hypothetical protein
MTRIVYDPRTKIYIERRMKEGLSKREAMRCLKRYVARELSTGSHNNQWLDTT